MEAVDLAFDLQPLQHVPLVRVGADLQPGQASGLAGPGRRRRGPPRERLVEPRPSRSGSYDAKASVLQYASKVASNFPSLRGLATQDSRTFHSRPSSRAALDRLEQPT